MLNEKVKLKKKTNNRAKKKRAESVSTSVQDIPRWKALGFQDQLHYLDYKRNNDFDSVINDIDDFIDNYNW